MSHLQAMVTHVDGLISRVPQYKKSWCMQGVQAAWRLGRWDLMDEYLAGADEEGPVCSSSESTASFDMDVAKILQAMMKKDQLSVAEIIAHSKQALLAPLAAAGMDSYMRAYPLVVKLHMLRELEDFHNILVNDSFLEKSFHLDDSNFLKVVQDWDNRLRFTQPSLWPREPLLAFRRLVFGASGLGVHVGSCWLQYAKLCRSAGQFEIANRAILEAQSSGATNFHLEKAKLLWSTRRTDGALAELQQSLLNMPVDVVGSAAISSLTSRSLVPLNPPFACATQLSNENKDVAKTLLLYSRWIHYTGQKQKEDVLGLYSRVRDLLPMWEKAYFYMAKYCDDLLVDARKRQDENLGPGSRLTTTNAVEKAWWSYLSDALLYYSKGLQRGHKNLFQALPRLLTLWFDFGSVYNRMRSTSELRNHHKKVEISVPEQVLFSFGSSSFDTLMLYLSKFKIILQVMSIMRDCLKDLPKYQWLTALPQLVSRICHQNEETVRLVKLIITSVLQEFPQQALWIMAAVSKSTIPARREAASEIIQAARKRFAHGSEGSNLFVQFPCLIEHLIKLCFHPGQPKARTINIATEFSALKRIMPLGIIMPIQQALTVSLPSFDANMTDPLRSDIFSATDIATISGIKDEAEILSSLQRPKKVIFIGNDGVEHPFLCKPKDDLRKDARMMEFMAMVNRLLSKYPESRRRKLYIRTFAVIPLTEDCGWQDARMFPPVFHNWFVTMFSEPAAWFRARIAYAHTTAVWSMVGHIVGLGDRHGENILFDSTTGDCVHVDFSCLFDRGLQLEKPELVPFRLTQNMIDGLGITGYEGIFLRVCEITLSVLRTHRETLMSVLETFIHDPLVEWTKSHKSSGVEVDKPHAQSIISENQEVSDPFYVLDLGVVCSLMDQWSSNLPTVRPFYAVKCNPEPTFLAALAALGVCFDCASKAEIEAVLALGINTDQIVFANPCKAEAHIKYAATVGVNLTTFDSQCEIEKIKKWHPKCALLLRIKAGDDADARCPLGLKYGALPEEVTLLLQAAHAAGLPVTGVSFHVGSATTFSQAYRSAIVAAKSVFDTAEQLGMPKLRTLNIGGGFVAGPQFENAAITITDALQSYFGNEPGLEIISEPGRFFAETSFTLVICIIGKRVRGELREYWVNDGIYGSLNCILFDHATVTATPLACKSDSTNPTCDGPKTYQSTVFGPTCDALDTILTDYKLPELEVNDWLVFPNVGAYTACAGSKFNGFDTSAIPTYVAYSDPK
ncbi:hypothetical protein IFM89_020375 [Coptis chinensis]|uniref:Serine/threonine-protein kinase ATR n=1 Tax=Coptis chinensis TaxID=261450 RepID=A0A835HNG3_9MAGN|nr:hypothetical protein IFM89_020375 [Coptis chinensis]